jgi:hypothetical protein
MPRNSDQRQSAADVDSRSLSMALRVRVRVTAFLKRRGEIMVQILDADRRTIEVEIPSADIVHFTPGQTVQLGFPGDTARTGVVSSISPQATSEAAPEAGRDAPIKLVIAPSGKLWPEVPIGSRVMVSASR